MSFVRKKYCKHCEQDHPYDDKHYFLNGGLLRKCKKFYSAYEAARDKARRAGIVWTKSMYVQVQKKVRAAR